MANLHPWPRNGNTIDFVQHICASSDRIWQAFTTEEGLQQWLKVTNAQIPLSPEAPFYLRWETKGRVSGKDCGMYSGFVKKIIPYSLLALDWILPFSKVTTQFSLQIQKSYALFGESREGECDVWITHSGFPLQGMGLFEYDGHFRHWRQHIGDLAAWLEGRPGKPTPYALAGLQFVGGATDIGLLVSDVMIDSPAHLAGIKSGDIIRAIEGQPLHSLDDFHDWIDERTAGESGVFSLQDRDVTVTVESVEAARNRFLIRQGSEWVPRR